MTRWAAPAVIAALLGVTAAPADAAHADRCYKAHSKTLTATKDVRVYWPHAGVFDRLYACAIRTGKSRSLGPTNLGDEGNGVLNPTIGGRYVAFEVSICDRDVDCRRSELRVMDALTGTTRRTQRFGIGAAGVTDLVVRANGTAAFLEAFQTETGTTTYELRRFDGTTSSVLDSGPGLVNGSLALAGATLYWTKDGQPRSAQL